MDGKVSFNLLTIFWGSLIQLIFDKKSCSRASTKLIQYARQLPPFIKNSWQWWNQGVKQFKMNSYICGYHKITDYRYMENGCMLKRIQNICYEV